MESNKELVLENFFHEIANLAPILNKSSDEILIAIPEKDEKKINKQALEHHSTLINEIVETIIFHLSLVNIELNPEYYSFQKPQPLNLHGAFFRISKIIRAKARSKNVNVKFIGDEIPFIETLPIAKTIPYIIFDNAIKYSPTYSEIVVDFSKNETNIMVEFSSIGPFIDEYEIINLTEKGYRGENAVQANPDGKGIGLFYLQKICDICNIHYKISSDSRRTNFNGIDYSKFNIKLIFDR